MSDDLRVVQRCSEGHQGTIVVTDHGEAVVTQPLHQRDHVANQQRRAKPGRRRSVAEAVADTPHD